MGESMVGLERASSIENEPLTLNIEQIQFAREAVLCVVNTRSVEEAVRIFTVGLEPVVSCGRGNNGTMVDYGEEVDYSIHHLTIPRFKDIASAPF